MERAPLLVVALLALGACGGSKVADPPVAPSSSAAHTSSAAASPTGPPTMPALAKQHSDKGAKAFVGYFWDVVTAARRSADSALLTALIDPHCGGCSGAVRAINDERSDGGRVVGGGNSVADLHISDVPIGNTVARVAIYTVTTAPETETYPASAPSTSPQEMHRLRMVLIPSTSGWLVDRLDPLP